MMLNRQLTLLLALIGLTSFTALAVTIPQEGLRPPISVLNIDGFPVLLRNASLINMAVDSRIEMEVTNNLSESVLESHFRVLIYDKNAKLSATEDGFISDTVPAGESRHFRAEIGRSVNPPEKSFVILTKVRTPSGVWFIAEQQVLATLNPNSKPQANVSVPVNYEPDLALTSADKDEILRSVFTKLLNTPENEKHLGKSKRLLVLRDTCGIGLTKHERAIEAVSEEQLQWIANREGRTLFIRCEPFEIEGSRVTVHLILNDRFAQGSERILVPFRFNYRFVCTKRHNKWVVEESFGYS